MSSPSSVGPSFSVASFVPIYADLFKGQCMSLSKTCDVFESRLNAITDRHAKLQDAFSCKLAKTSRENNWPSAAAYLERNRLYKNEDADQLLTMDSSKQGVIEDKKLLLQMRNLCALSIQAKQKYYDTTVLGAISQLFQSFGKCFGIKTSIERAEDILARCDASLQRNFQDYFVKEIDPSLPSALESDALVEEANLQPAIEFMRSRAIQEDKTVHIIPGASFANPTQVLIARPNGDVIVFNPYHTNCVGKGSGRSVYKGLCYSNGEPKPKKIAIATTMPILREWSQLGILLDQPDRKEQIQVNNSKLDREYRQLQKLSEVEGVVKIHDQFSLEIEDVEFTFATMDYYPLGDLNNVLSGKSGITLTQTQKQYLINSLIKIYSRIHKMGELHRDVKEQNILIKFDPINELYDPIVIDFETSTSTANQEQLAEVTSTATYWPPEYVQAFLKNPDVQSKEVAQIPGEALDRWGLGIVLYRIWYGKDFLSALGYVAPGINQVTVAEAIHELFESKNLRSAFPEELDPIGQEILGMPEPPKKIRPKAAMP